MSFWIMLFLFLDAQEKLHSGQRPLLTCFIKMPSWLVSVG